MLCSACGKPRKIDYGGGGGFEDCDCNIGANSAGVVSVDMIVAEEKRQIAEQQRDNARTKAWADRI
jgi:hypothetical protein